MVGLHVIDYEIVNLAVAYDLLDILDIRNEEIHLDSVDEANLLVINDIRVIRNSIWQRPQAFEQVLVAVIHAHIINLVCNFLHDI